MLCHTQSCAGPAPARAGIMTGNHDASAIVPRFDASLLARMPPASQPINGSALRFSGRRARRCLRPCGCPGLELRQDERLGR